MRRLISIALLINTCSTAIAAEKIHSNPLATPSALPLQAPPFNLIKDTDYRRAFIEAMAQQTTEVNAIANNPVAPTFENTMIALEKSGRMLDRTALTFDAVVQANTNKTLDNIQAEMAPRRAMQQDSIYLNPKLFSRIKKLYEQRDSLPLDPESLQLLKITYQQFVHAGANLSPADKQTLQQINKRIATLEITFQQKLLAGTKAGAVVINKKSRLTNLSAEDIATTELDAKSRGLKNKYLITLQNTTQQPWLASLTDRALRETLFNHSWLRTERNDKNDTRTTIAQIAQLRAQKAKLLGYPNFAAYVLYDQMAQTPQAVDDFLTQLVPPTAKKITQEANLIQAAIDKDKLSFKLQPWDWERYAEQVRKEKYDLNEAELRPYFELNRVLIDGVFYAATQLYGITFKERHDIPVYQADVRVFDVFDNDGSQLGLLYVDLFKRDNKMGGAWMNNFVNQSKLFGTKPVIYMVLNIPKPAPGQSALISFDHVTALFHEFGHALHGLFANQQYETLSGTQVARDFVEFPSQFNEHWALDPTILKHYAINNQTHQPIPDTLVDKIKRSHSWNQGYDLGELLAASELDMQWHMLPASAPKQNVDAFETKALQATHTDFPNVPSRYRSSYFLHIWNNGYAAGYYAYQWTSMLENDAYAWFKQHGGLTRENGQRFRDMILSKGHTEDYGPMFKNFYGKDPEIGPLLEHRGLI